MTAAGCSIDPRVFFDTGSRSTVQPLNIFPSAYQGFRPFFTAAVVRVQFVQRTAERRLECSEWQ